MNHERSGRRWTRIFNPDARAEVEDELSFHFEQRVQENIARGMDPEAARAAAQQRLGDLKTVQSECTDLLIAERRSEKRREWARFSWLDFKLGFRMLAKYPGLTIVGGIAIAFAIMMGTVAFEFMIKMVRPSLNLADGDRIVAMRLWDASRSRVEKRSAHELATWGAELKTIGQIGAYHTMERNLVGSNDVGFPAVVAAMTASGFQVARVAPLLGRPLVDDDARPGAPAVIVIGEQLWRTAFEADPGILGRVVRVGNDPHTVVGVMPGDFAFPMYHEAWVPLELNAAGYAPLEGPGLALFGRLTDGSTLDVAQSELTALGDRAARESPQTHRHLRPSVIPYANSYFDEQPDALVGAYFSNSFMLLFMLLLYANVALLMFGRAATREGEIVVRNALGASRARILTQLFTEALVLGAFAALIGVLVARFGLGTVLWFLDLNNVKIPFWFRDELSPITALYVVGVTILAAVLAGVVPGLKATRGIGTQLRAASAGAGGLRFGGIWTAIIVTQVAFTVAFFPFLISLGVSMVKARNIDLGVAAAEYLTLRVARDPQAQTSGDPRSVDAIYAELKRRVAAEPGVRGVTFATELPGQFHPVLPIEVEGVDRFLPSGIPLRAQRAFVDPDFVDVMGISVRSGRAFRAADAKSDARVVIVNQSFARTILGGRNPIGRRVRYLSRDPGDPQSWKAGPWNEVIGVTNDVAFGVLHLVDTWNFTGEESAAGQPGIYHPLALENTGYDVSMAIHVDADPLSYVGRLRSIVTAVDPALRMDKVMPLENFASDFIGVMTLYFRILLGAGALALLLSLAGIYSIMSFTVSRRTREIGIRVALGSTRRGIMAAMFSRAMVHIGIGVAVGVLVFVWFSDGLGWFTSATMAARIVAYATTMAGVCLLACVVPARRALR
ncbi:MAG: ABC transporter permease, partial [Gemmatimonadota bacterium]